MAILHYILQKIVMKRFYWSFGNTFLMKMGAQRDESVVQELKGMVALHETCGDLAGKLTCLSILGHHYLNVGQLSEALETFRQFFKESFNLNTQPDDSLLELTANAASAFATALRFKGYVEASLYYYLSALKAFLRLGRHSLAVREYFLLQYFSHHHPMQVVLTDQITSARMDLMKDLTTSEILIKLEHLLNLLWKKQKLVTRILLQQKSPTRMEKEILMHVLSTLRQQLTEPCLRNEIKLILLVSCVELELLTRLSESRLRKFMTIDNVLTLITHLNKTAPFEFLRAHHDMVASKVAILGGDIEGAFECFNKAMIQARQLNHKELLIIRKDELNCLRQAVDMIAVASKPSQRLLINLMKVTRVFHYLRSLELGFTASYVESSSFLGPTSASSFIRQLQESQSIVT